MNYEERYKQAIEAAKRELHCCGSLDCDAARQIFRFFPELRESEDEKISKEITSFLENVGVEEIKKIPRDISEWFTWLKKQGNHNEQNFWEMCNHCEYFDGYDLCLHKMNFGAVTDELKENCRNNKLFIEKQDEQKPWSEEDEKMLEDTISCLSAYQSPDISKGLCYQEQIDWLKSLKPQPRPKREWSEEDEEMFDAIIADIKFTQKAHNYDVDQVVYEEEIDWLKSIKDRVQSKQEWGEYDKIQLSEAIQMIEANGTWIRSEDAVKKVSNWLKSIKPNHWKPSKEQMEELEYVTRGNSYPHLTSLYQDLKNFKS